MKALISGGPDFVRVARAIAADEYIALFPQVAKALHDADLKVMGVDVLVEQEDWPEMWSWLGGLMNLSLNGTEISSAITGFILNRLPQFLPIIVALDRASPDVLVLHNDVEPMTKLAALWARERGVPCVHVPHAVYVDCPWVEEEDVHGIVTATHLAAVSPYQAAWYRKRAEDLNITITGAPRWDWIASWDMTKDRARELLHIPGGEFVVTYATSWSQATSKAGLSVDPFQAFLSFLERMRGKPVKLIVKIHPADHTGQRYVQAALDSGVPAIVTQAHLKVVLTAADALVAFGPSNIVLEAAALGVPVICHRSPFPHPSVPWQEEIDFEDLISLSLEPGDLLPTFMGPLDGHALDRVVAFVRSL